VFFNRDGREKILLSKEISIIRDLQHPQITKMISYGENEPMIINEIQSESKYCYQVFELYEGFTLG